MEVFVPSLPPPSDYTFETLHASAVVTTCMPSATCQQVTTVTFTGHFDNLLGNVDDDVYCDLQPAIYDV